MKSNSVFEAPLNPSLYELLGVSRTIDKIGLRARYKQLCKSLHPDVTILPPEVAADKFIFMHRAIHFLLDENLRRLYDQQLLEFEQNYTKSNNLDERYGWSMGDIFLDFVANYKKPDYDWSISATSAKRSFRKDAKVFLVVWFRDFLRDVLNR